MVQFRPQMHDYRIQHPVQIYTCSITQYYLNSITLKQRNSLDKMKMVYIVNTLQHDKMKCRSIRQEFHSLSWNRKSPSSNISKCHGPIKPSLVNIDTTGFNFKPFFQTWLQSWGLSTLQIPSLIQFSYAKCLPHQHHNLLFP